MNATGRHWPGRDEVAAAKWIERHTVRNQPLVTALKRDLDRGEAESIVLALELSADLVLLDEVLLDEKEGRHMAQRQGLKLIGVIGVLLEAKGKSMVGNVRPHLDALRQIAGFYIKDSLYQAILTLTKETDGSIL